MCPWCVKIIQCDCNAKNQNLNYVLVIPQLVILKLLFIGNSLRSNYQNLRYFQIHSFINIKPLYLLTTGSKSKISKCIQSLCHYDFLSHNLGHPHEPTMTLAVPSYSNIPLVHSSPGPSKMNSKQSFLTIMVSFHVNQITTRQSYRYSST